MERKAVEDFIGIHKLSGVERAVKEMDDWGYKRTANTMRFVVDGVVYEAAEDPDDGYRSTLDEIYVLEGEKVKFTFPPTEVLGVCPDEDGKRTICFYDVVSGKKVLEIGTEYYDSYYPCCVMTWIPMNLAVNGRGKIETGEQHD